MFTCQRTRVLPLTLLLTSAFTPFRLHVWVGTFGSG